MSKRSSITRSYWIHALTPLHVGSGRGVGFVDLPIMREIVTNWPFVPGSAVKGVLADHFEAYADKRDPVQKMAFGSAGNEYSNSGSLVFTDARLVCLPVRSLFGTFAWCTSPIALERWRRDVDPKAKSVSAAAPKPDRESLIVPQADGNQPQSQLFQKVVEGNIEKNKAFFEDLDFEVQPHAAATIWAREIAEQVFPDRPRWQALFKERFAIVHDEIFDFLCETATQVDARVRINEETKSVASGQLWYEESLPAETILAGLAWCGPVFGSDNRHDPKGQEDLMKRFCSGSKSLQIGGKATVGRGQVTLSFTELPAPASGTAVQA